MSISNDIKDKESKTYNNEYINSNAETEENRLRIELSDDRNNKCVADKEESFEESEQNMNNSLNQDSSQDTNTSLSRKRRTIDRGLDGGYWSTLQMSSITDKTRAKRTRVSVDRLENTYLLPLISMSNTSSTSSEVARASGVSLSGKSNQHRGRSSRFVDDKSQTDQDSENESEKNEQERVIMFKAHSFMAVRNEEGTFYLSQATTNVYETSKKTKIQWFEEIGPNKYKLGDVDWLDPQSIISKVHMKRIGEHTYKLSKVDRCKVNDLLARALQEGGIEAELGGCGGTTTEAEASIDSPPKTLPRDKQISTQSVDKQLYSANNKKKTFDDIYNNEETTTTTTTTTGSSSSESEDKIGKNKARKKTSISSESSKSQKERKTVDGLDEPSELEKNNSNSNKLANKSEPNKKQPTSTVIIKDLIGKSIDSLSSTSSSSSSSSSTASASFLSSSKTNTTISSDKAANLIDQAKKKEGVCSSSISNRNSNKMLKSAVNCNDDIHREGKLKKKEREKEKNTDNKKLLQNESDTEELESEDEITTAALKKPSKSSKQKLQEPVNNLLTKKRRLLKVMSNRLLQENFKVTVFLKDPFFEEIPREMPFISSYVQSKLAITAVILRDMNMLKRLIDDVGHIASDMLEVLIDDFLAPKAADRIQIAESMFEKFSTGVYNQRSLGIAHVRKLTESRGSKQGNAALSLDQPSTVKFVGDAQHKSRLKYEFFKCLFEYAYECGASTDLFDFLVFKWNTQIQKQLSNGRNGYYQDHNTRFIYENVFMAVVNGHRKLAAHAIHNAPPGHGFNQVHIQVLQAENDADLTCQLRASMCTKKPFSNEVITPIHCAAINPNVKYLKTLLSITQDFNIADKRGRRPIHFSAVCEGPTPLEYLISRVSPYEMDNLGNYPIHYASMTGRPMNLEILLNYAQKKQEDDSALTTEVIIDNKHGLGGINKPNKRGQLPLHLCIAKAHYDCVKVLIKYGCNLEYPLPNSRDKITPLQFSCQIGNLKIVKLLVENGAKVEARDRFHRTALIHAIIAGQLDIVSYLLRLGANPNAMDSSGNYCLHYACAYGWYYAVRLLVEAGAILNVTNDWKLNAFSCAFLKGHVGICEQLLSYSKNIDINFRTDEGETLVMLCVSHASILNEASVEQLDFIVNKLGGNCTLLNSKGSNAFHYLAANRADASLIENNIREGLTQLESSNLDVGVEQLVKKQVSEKLAEQEQLRSRMASILLTGKCNPNGLNNQLETPLFTAVANCNTYFARFLLSHRQILCRVKAKPNAQGKNLLALMADKCLEIDPCSVIFRCTEQNEDYSLFEKFRAEFEIMASTKDQQNDSTPFQVTTVKIREFLETSSNSKQTKLPHSLTRFLLFLYRDCKSNPNELIRELKIKSMGRGRGNYSEEKKEEEAQEQEQEEEGEEEEEEEQQQQQESSNEEMEADDLMIVTKKNKINRKYSYHSPMTNLISNKCIDLLEKLIMVQNENGDLLPKLNLYIYDSEGLNPLLRSLIIGETEFACKLIELECALDPKRFLSTMSNQICLNNVSHLSESFLQLAIRHKCQVGFLNRFFDLLVTCENEKAEESLDLEMLARLLHHENSYKQNFLHTLAELSFQTDVMPNLVSLSQVIDRVSRFFFKSSEHCNIIFDLAMCKDSLGRTPLHICLLNSGKRAVEQQNNSSSNTNIDFEIFFIEKILTSISTINLARNATKEIGVLFGTKDVFDRLPIHYLFYNNPKFDQLAFMCHNLYQQSDSSISKIIKTNQHIVFSNDLNSSIDPVELLTILLNHTDCSQIDALDCLGYTPLHYACIRASSIACSVLLSHGANPLRRAAPWYNTPLASAVYYKRETCTLMLLNHIKAQDKQQQQLVLDDFYRLPSSISLEKSNGQVQSANKIADNLLENGKECSFPALKWNGREETEEKNLYPTESQSVYKLVLSNHWEGINWLVLANLSVYGLDDFVSIQTTIAAGQFSLGLRLIEKLEGKLDAVELLRLLTTTTTTTTKSLDETNTNKEKKARRASSTLLHTIANIDWYTLNENDKETLLQILKKIFVTQSDKNINEFNEIINDYFQCKDDLGSNWSHYACYMCNFDLVDFVFAYLERPDWTTWSRNSSQLTVASPDFFFKCCKDAAHQTAYALLFWQIGKRSTSSPPSASKRNQITKEKIKTYTMRYIYHAQSSNGVAASKLEQVARAHFPFLPEPSFTSTSSLNTSYDNSSTSDPNCDYPPFRANTFNEQNNKSPLLYAINRQNFDTVKFLIKDLEFDVNVTDNQQVCALVYAIRTNNVDICKLLLNFDYEPSTFTATTIQSSSKRNSVNTNNKVNSRMKQFLINKNKAISIQNDEENMSDEVSEDEDDLIEEANEPQQDNELAVERTSEPDSRIIAEFKINSNIILNHLDSNSCTIFHHLASSLWYGSFANLNLAKLLIHAYQYAHSLFKSPSAAQISSVCKMVPLNEFLGRVDSNIKKASDYALEHGNCELYDEYRRVQKIAESNSGSFAGLKSFDVDDPAFSDIQSRLADQIKFQADADQFLKEYMEKQQQCDAIEAGDRNFKISHELRALFKVDPMSNMSKTGCLVWDEKAGVPFDVILTKTDVSYGMYGMHNFYKIQLLTQLFENSTAAASSSLSFTSSDSIKSNMSRVCVLFTKWGRIGDAGQCQRTPFATIAEAKSEFIKIFKQKTGNDFIETVIEKTCKFESKPRRYNLVSYYSRKKLKLKDIDFNILTAEGQNLLLRKSPFPPGFRNFWCDLLNVEHLKQTVRLNTSLSVNYLPLTQLNDTVLASAYNLLTKKLSPQIERRMELEKLSKKEHLMEYMQLLDTINRYSNEFYQLIPQMNYNYEKLRPISNEKELNIQLCLLNQLNNAHIACRLLMAAKQAALDPKRLVNPLEYVYASLACKLELLEPNSSEAQYILRYTYPYCQKPSINYKVQQIFKIERVNEQKRSEDFRLPSNSSTLRSNRRLLWHGTATENILSILSKGLSKSPSDASRITGQKYGEGIYFSDAFESSIGYARGIRLRNKQLSPSFRVYMLVCEVALGKIKELRTSYEVLDQLPAGFDSVKAFGRLEPDPLNDIYMPNGSILPLGELVSTPFAAGEYFHSRNSKFNEYVVYNEAQVCLRYIIQCQVNSN